MYIDQVHTYYIGMQVIVEDYHDKILVYQNYNRYSFKTYKISYMY